MWLILLTSLVTRRNTSCTWVDALDALQLIAFIIAWLEYSIAVTEQQHWMVFIRNELLYYWCVLHFNLIPSFAVNSSLVTRYTSNLFNLDVRISLAQDNRNIVMREWEVQSVTEMYSTCWINPAINKQNTTHSFLVIFLLKLWYHMWLRRIIRSSTTSLI